MDSNLELEVPGELAGGSFADFVGVWHSSDIFTLDFASVISPPRVLTNEVGETTSQISARVVSRVRVPPAQVFELMKALERELSAWERERGEVPPSETA